MVKVEFDQARTILVPTGRDYYRCVQMFEEMLGAKVPDFEPRLLSAQSAGRRYVRVKGKDVPTFVSDGHADLGLTGTDVCEEQIPDDPADSNLRYQAAGEPMCTFELLLPKPRVEELRPRLANEEAEPVVIATSFPNFLRKSVRRLAGNGSKLNIVISPVRPSGSVEVLPQLGMCDAVADLVESGETAHKNGLARLPIAKVFPAIIWRDPDSMARTPPVGSPYRGSTKRSRPGSPKPTGHPR
jgi:ATP phosphoribosyltransferase